MFLKNISQFQKKSTRNFKRISFTVNIWPTSVKWNAFPYRKQVQPWYAISGYNLCWARGKSRRKLIFLDVYTCLPIFPNFRNYPHITYNNILCYFFQNTYIPIRISLKFPKPFPLLFVIFFLHRKKSFECENKQVEERQHKNRFAPRQKCQ